MQYRKYVPGDKLKEHEYLLKISNSKVEYANLYVNAPKGFLTKLNKGNNKPPQKFLDWLNSFCWDETLGKYVKQPTTSEIYIVDQSLFRTGWMLLDYRPGQSQDWVKILHPDDYIIEITASHFYADIMPNVYIDRGHIAAAMRWVDGKLEILD